MHKEWTHDGGDGGSGGGGGGGSNQIDSYDDANNNDADDDNDGSDTYFVAYYKRLRENRAKHKSTIIYTDTYNQIKPSSKSIKDVDSSRC